MKMIELQKNYVEMGNLPEKEFSVMIIKMIKELGRRTDARSKQLEVLNEELENIKNNQR